MRLPLKPTAGFGLPELLISLGLASVALLGAFQWVSSSTRITGKKLSEMRTGGEVSRFQERLQSDLWQAGYNLVSPLNTTPAQGILQAEGEKLSIQADLDDKVPGPERIDYQFDSAQGILFRNGAQSMIVLHGVRNFRISYTDADANVLEDSHGTVPADSLRDIRGVSVEWKITDTSGKEKLQKASFRVRSA